MIVVITGPTCTGKSKIAVEVAKAINGEIVNADAFQVYQELDIGTAKPSFDALNQVKHHLYSYIKPDEDFSIFRYQKDARNVINNLLKENKNVVLVGGSGLYIRAALYDYSFNQEKKIDLSDLDKLSDEELHNKLKEVDKVQANKIHPNNRRRVFRALEIYYSSGKTKTEIEQEQKHTLMYENVHIYTVSVGKDELYKRINERVDVMFKNGLENEAINLGKKYGKDKQSLQAIGYKEILSGADDAKELIKKNTRHYAKRQMTFNRYQYGNLIKEVRSAEEIINDLKK